MRGYLLRRATCYETQTQTLALRVTALVDRGVHNQRLGTSRRLSFNRCNCLYGYAPKVGASLWVSWNLASNAPYFSEDLVTWKTQAQFLDSGFKLKAENKDGVEFFVKENNEVIILSTGLAEMDQAGLLEKNTAVGNYTRNGLL